MNHLKIERYEKLLVKGLLAMYAARGITPNACSVEIDLKNITDNRNTDHRNAVEDYIDTLIQK